jgi:hypothetical protein
MPFSPTYLDFSFSPCMNSKKNERYFLSGSKLVDLMEESAQKLTKALAAKSGGGTSGRGRNARQMQASLDNLRKEAAELQQTLIAVRAYNSDNDASTLMFSTVPYHIDEVLTIPNSCQHKTKIFFSLSFNSFLSSIFHFRRIPGNVCDKHWTGPGVRWAMMSQCIRKS